jgi:outer membrane protein assembly factor BamB
MDGGKIMRKNKSYTGTSLRIAIGMMALAILLLAGGASALSNSEIGTSDWPTHNRDFQRTGYTSEDVTLPLVQKWNFTTGGDSNRFVEPAVVNGTIYWVKDGKLYALNLNTGVMLWNKTLVEVTGSPTVVDGIVYVGTRGKVYAVYACNGTIKWEYNVNSDAQISTPVVYNGTVYIGYGIYWSGPYGFVALSAHDGSYVWSYSDGDAFWSPAYYNGAIFVGSQSGKVYSFNHATGAINWQYDTGGPWVWNFPSISNGVVYAQGGTTGPNMGKLYAFDASNGTVLWTITPDTDRSFLTPVTITSDTLYLVTYVPYQEQRNELFAIDTVTRTVKWNFGEKLGLTLPVVAGNKVIIGSADNNLSFLDADNGTVLWQYNLNASVYSVIVSNNVVLVSAGNALYAFKGQDIMAYYRDLGNNSNVVETTDLLKAADDWSRNIAPLGFTSPVTTQQLLMLADEWSRG